MNTNTSACGNIGSATVTPGGGLGTYTYSWNDPSVQATAIATSLGVGSFTATVLDSNGCSATSNIAITAPAAAAANAIVNTNTTSCSSLGSATAGALGGTAPYTYLWSDALAQTNANATGLSAGVYNVSVTDAGGCPGTPANVTITAPAPAVANISGSTNTSACANNIGTATVGATGGGTLPYTFLWSDPGAQTNTLATGLSAGSYTVNVKDGDGCAGVPATVTINPDAPVTVSALVLRNTSACGINLGQARANPGGGTGPYTYSWTDPLTQTNQTATGLSAGSYTVNITDANNCPASSNISIAAPPPLGQTTSFTPSGCGFSTGTASVLASGGNSPYTYLWTPGLQTNATATNVSAATYTVQLTDADNCNLTASVTVTSVVTEVIAFTAHTDISCNGGNNGSITANTTLGSAPYTYSWTPVGGNAPIANNLTSGVYTVQVQDANGCTNSASFGITQPLVPLTVSTSNIVSLACSGDTNGQATADPLGGVTPYTYSWSPSGGSNSIGTYLTAGTYTINLTDAHGCTASATATIGNGNPSPVVSFSADSVKGCAPFCVGFKDLTTIVGGTLQSWAWTFGDGNTSAMQNTGNCYSNAGAYTVSLSVTSNLGCTRKSTLRNLINVYSYPKAKFKFTPQPTTILNPTISFTDKSTDTYGITNWQWTFGDITDSTSISPNPVHTYADSGTYPAILIVTNAKGCSDTVTENVIISPQYALYIPTAFTPNNDGLNDVFMPKGDAVISFQMNIFDRWGTLLYSTSDMSKGWNGKVLGKPSPEDTYIYNIQVTDNFLNYHTYIGDFNLIH